MQPSQLFKLLLVVSLSISLAVLSISKTTQLNATSQLADISVFTFSYDEAQLAYSSIGCSTLDSAWPSCSKFDLNLDGTVTERDYFCYKEIQTWLTHEQPPGTSPPPYGSGIPLPAAEELGVTDSGIWIFPGHPWYEYLATPFYPVEEQQDDADYYPSLKEPPTPSLSSEEVATIIAIGTLLSLTFLIMKSRKLQLNG